MSPPRKTARQRRADAVQRLIDARAEQGLAPTITDPVALDQAAVLFVDANAATHRPGSRFAHYETDKD
jgi:hypothetical protein